MKNKILFRILQGMTLALPISITLVVSAIWSKPTPDLVILFETTTPLKKVEDVNKYFTMTENDKHLDIVNHYYPNDDYDYNAFNVNYLNIDFTPYDKVATTDGIVKFASIKAGSYIRMITDDFDKVIELDKGEIKAVGNINIQTGNKLSLSFIISIIATAIVVLVISKKMQFHKTHPKSATFIALLSATIFLGVINAIIGSIVTVFIVATISWGAFCLEDAYYKSMKQSYDGQQTQSALLNDLEKILNDNE